MDIKNIRRSVQLLFIATIFELISVIATLTFILAVDWPRYFGICGIIALILYIIAILRIKNECKKFHSSFYWMIASFIILIVGTILFYIPATYIFGAYIILFANLCSTISTYYVISGCEVVVNNNGTLELAKFANGVKYTYVFAFLIECILGIIIILPAVQTNSVATIILGVIRICFQLLAFISYLVLLRKTYKILPENEQEK